MSIQQIARGLEALSLSAPQSDQSLIAVDTCDEYILVDLPRPVSEATALLLRRQGWFAWTESRADTEVLVWAYDTSRETDNGK